MRGETTECTIYILGPDEMTLYLKSGKSIKQCRLIVSRCHIVSSQKGSGWGSYNKLCWASSLCSVTDFEIDKILDKCQSHNLQEMERVATYRHTPIIPALRRRGRRTVSSRPIWATYWDPATNKRKQKYLLINFLQCWQSYRARFYTLWAINQTYLHCLL